MLRLQKYLAECGLASRRSAETLIREGRVHVNGQVAILGQSVDPANDHVQVDDSPVRVDHKVYVVLNKPANVITTAKDTHGRKTVMDCLDGLGERVFPVGRLDRDVEGVLIFTNDGEMAHRLMHPRFGVKKVYLAWVYGQVTSETVKRLETGVSLEDGMTAPARAVILNATKNSTLLRLTLHEGRKREVKRMCAAVGHPIETLHRIAFGGIGARGLRPGEWRRLSVLEIDQLRRMVGLAQENGS